MRQPPGDFALDLWLGPFRMGLLDMRQKHSPGRDPHIEGNAQPLHRGLAFQNLRHLIVNNFHSHWIRFHWISHMQLGWLDHMFSANRTNHCDICIVSSMDKVGRSAIEESAGLAVMRK